jgi:hypothetical protein
MSSNQEEIMKWMKQTSLAFAVGISLITAQATPVVEKPAVMPEAMLSVTVPDLQGLLDGIGSVAAQTSPMMNGMMIKNMIGMQLGDPGLAGIAPGKGLSVVLLNTTNFFAVVEVAEAQSAAYANAVKAQGIQSSYTNGVLVLGQSPDMVAKGVEMTASVQSTLLAKRTPTLRIAGQPAAIVERNNEQIQGFLKMMPALMGMGMLQAPGATTNSVDNTMKILEGEIRILLSIASQCESGELVIAPDKGSVRLSETYVAKAGTRLAKLGESPKTSKPNSKVQSGILSDDGMVLLDFVLGSPEALADFIVAELNHLAKEMNLKDAELAGLTDCIVKWTALYGGSGCETFDFDAEEGMSVNYLLEVGNEAKALSVLKSMEKDVAPFIQLYEKLGMPMKLEFKENVGEHKEIKLHRLEVEISLEDMPEAQREQFDVMDLDDLDYDIAIFDGLLLYTMGDNKINEAIDRIKDSATVIKPLASRSVFPADGFYYCDLDIGRYIEFAVAMIPEDDQDPIFPQLVAMMQGVDPITSAGFRQDGRVMCSVNIPGDLIGKLGQVGMMMQMQKMQQQQMQQGMPAAMPQTLPAP